MSWTKFIFAILCIWLVWTVPTVEAQTITGKATLTWDAYTPPVDFKEIRIFRANQNCSAQGPLAPLMIGGVQATVKKNATGTVPSTFVDDTLPVVDGVICYELNAVDTLGNESVRSNRPITSIDTVAPPTPKNVRVEVEVKTTVTVTTP